MFVSICSLLGVKGVFRKLAFGLAQLGCPHPIAEYPCSGPSFLLTYTLRGSCDGTSGQVLPPTEETSSHVWLLALDPGQPPPSEDSGEGSELAVDVLLSLSLCFQIKACGKWKKKTEFQNAFASNYFIFHFYMNLRIEDRHSNNAFRPIFIAVLHQPQN